MQAQEPGLVETCLQGFSSEDFPSDPSAIQGENILKKRGSVADQDGICFDAVQCSQGIPMHLQYLCVCVCVPWAMFSSAKSSNWKESVGWSSRPIADFMLESFWVLSGPNS